MGDDKDLEEKLRLNFIGVAKAHGKTLEGISQSLKKAMEKNSRLQAILTEAAMLTGNTDTIKPSHVKALDRLLKEGITANKKIGHTLEKVVTTTFKPKTGTK